MPRPHWTVAEIGCVRRLAASDATLDVISEAIGRTEGAIRRICRLYGIAGVWNKNVRWTPDLVAAMRDAAERGETRQQFADRMFRERGLILSEETVGNRASYFGVRFHGRSVYTPHEFACIDALCRQHVPYTEIAERRGLRYGSLIVTLSRQRAAERRRRAASQPNPAP